VSVFLLSHSIRGAGNPAACSQSAQVGCARNAAADVAMAGHSRPRDGVAAILEIQESPDISGRCRVTGGTKV
jgi:hypothetical protein